MLLRLADIPFPAAPERWFGRDAPAAVEVGVGSGDFLVAFAADHPTWNVVGIDRSPASVARTWRAAHRHGTANVRLFLGSADFFLREVVARHSLQRIYLNFPDPWPRERHRHRRLLQLHQLRLISSRLGEAGSIHLTSDHERYFDFVMEQAQRCALYDVERGDPPVEVMRTKYARKSRDDWSHDIRHALLVKRDETHVAPTLRRRPMHHALLEGTLPDVDTFDKVVERFDDGHVVVQQVFRPLHGEGLLFLVRIVERDLTQDVLIEARARDDGGVLVGVKRFGEPLNTRGVHAAVDVVTSWFEARGLKVVDRKHRKVI